MFIKELTTTNPQVRLIKPDADRDTPISVGWLAGPQGRSTLKLMGVMDSLNQPSTLEQETHRIQTFLTNPDQYNWMIQLKDRVVGSIWVDRRPSKKLGGPAISLMIGDPAARGQGVGRAALQAVIGFLQSQGHRRIYACHIIENQASAALLQNLRFKPDGPPYIDSEDGLTWQNLVLETAPPASPAQK